MTAVQDDQWSSKAYNSNASFVYSSAFTSPVLDLLAAKPEEVIMDLGCGTGELTLKLAALVGPKGRVLGVDASTELITKARQNDATDAVEYVVLDGHDLALLPEKQQEVFDAVFSNAALHWMKDDPVKVAKGAYGTLKKGGRFVAEMGGFLNMVGVRSALHDVLKARGHAVNDPWYFPTPKKHTRVLEAAGFRVASCELVPRITPLPTGLRGWLDTFGFAFLGHLPQQEQAHVVDEVCKKLKVDLEHEDGWTVMYVRLRFVAWKD